MLKLVIPNISHKQQWEEVMIEWGNDWRKNPRIFFQDSYEELLQVIENVKEKDDFESMIPKSSLYFLFDNTELVWMYWLRHNLKYHDDAINWWHIGYWIRPSKRRNWYWKKWLALLLWEAKKIGFMEVFISCDDENIGSVNIIEANGWILEKVGLRYERKSRRYKVHLYQKEEEILTSLELELLTFKCRHTPERIYELLADDFFECGKMGTIFWKKECLERLPAEKEKQLTATDISIHIISPDIWQVRYIAEIWWDGESLTRSFRTSLWRKTETWWQMFFHQWTLLQ